MGQFHSQVGYFRDGPEVYPGYRVEPTNDPLEGFEEGSRKPKGEERRFIS